MTRDRALPTNDALDSAATVLWGILAPYQEQRDPDATEPVKVRDEDWRALVALYELMFDAARKQE